MNPSNWNLNSNRSLNHSLAMLSHPLTWLALALLLINDHLLRVVWPSWWTGKLGDFAWLFFTPFALAAAVSLLVPARWAHQEKIVAGLSFGATALVFGLAKTLPAAHALTVQIAAIAFQSQVSLRLDPSDLVALAVLLPAWRLWRRQPERPLGRLARGWLALPLAALLTMANSAAPNYGVFCLVPSQPQPIALAGYTNGYSTRDGGLTWQTVDWNEIGFWPICHSSDRTITCALVKGQPGSCSYVSQPGVSGFPPSPDASQNCTLALEGDAGICRFPPRETQQTLSSPLNPAIVFQYQAGDAIRVSTDGGQTWAQEFRLASSEAQADYLASTLKGFAAPGPLGGVVDPQTGNVLFAMGFEGLLVYRADTRAFQWVTLAGNTHKEIDPITLMAALISDEFCLGLVLGLLSVVSLALKFQRSTLRIFFLVIAWLVWGVAAIFLRHPYGYDPYGLQTSVPMYACIIASGLIGLVLLVKPVEKIGWFGVKVFIASLLLFFLPYILWALGSLPYYETARLFALVLAGVNLGVGWVLFRPQLQ